MIVEKHVQNDTINILILPNITYRFKIQLKDKHLNWTDVEETEPIMSKLYYNSIYKFNIVLKSILIVFHYLSTT